MPFKHLNDEEFVALTAHAATEELKAERVLFNTGRDDNWLFYLLDGAVRITDHSGDSFVVKGGTIESLHPLSPHPKARVRAAAESDIRFIRFPAELLQISAKPVAKAGIEVDEICEDTDAVDQRLLFEICHAIMGQHLVLPTLPDVAIRIRAAVEDDRKGIDDIARIIQADPALAAYCISLANNVAFATSAPASDIREAVMRMGITATRDFITAYSLKGLFQTRHPRCMNLMREAWRHSGQIGALSYVIMRRLGRASPETAMLTGLLHDIGVMVLIAEAQAHEELLQSESTLRAALKELKHQVTGLVLRAWKLPEALINAAFEAENWNRAGRSEIDLGDVLVLAHVHAEPPSAPWSNAIPEQQGLAILKRLPPATLNENGRLQIVSEASEELAKLSVLLGP